MYGDGTTFVLLVQSNTNTRKHDRGTARIQPVRPIKSRDSKARQGNVVHRASPSRMLENIAGEGRHASISQSDEHSKIRQGYKSMYSVRKDENTEGMTGGSKDMSIARKGDQCLCPENRRLPVQHSKPNQTTEVV